MATVPTRSAGRARTSAADDYSEQMLVCIQNCQDCHRACLQTLAYCMKQGGRHAAPEHLRLLMDCADVCLTSAAFMLRASDLHVHTCAACAAVCRRCAEDCADMGDDLRMKALADTCRHCAESCRGMAGGADAAAHAAHRGGDGSVRGHAGPARCCRGGRRTRNDLGAANQRVGAILPDGKEVMFWRGQIIPAFFE